MKQLIVNLGCRRHALGDAMRVCFGKSALRSPRRAFYRVIICAFLISSAFAQSDATFAKANQEYADRNFKEAIDGYGQLVRSGQWSANLFYDLGNAYFRTEDFGHANVNQFTIAAAVALWIAIFCIVVLIFARKRSGAVIGLSIVSLSILAVAVFAIYELDNGSNGRALAIVTGMNVQARVATADNANSVLALPPGSEIRVLSNRGDWIYAALPNNLRGWVPAKSAEAVRL